MPTGQVLTAAAAAEAVVVRAVQVAEIWPAVVQVALPAVAPVVVLQVLMAVLPVEVAALIVEVLFAPVEMMLIAQVAVAVPEAREHRTAIMAVQVVLEQQEELKMNPETRAVAADRLQVVAEAVMRPRVLMEMESTMLTLSRVVVVVVQVVAVVVLVGVHRVEPVVAVVVP